MGMPVDSITSDRNDVENPGILDPHKDRSASAIYDVAVIGGGAAGLSAAVALARFRRKVVVVDEGRPRNAPASHVHNLVSRDGASPAELYSIGRVEVARFGGQLVAGTVSTVGGQLGAFTLELEDETTISAGRVIVASGGWDELPDVAGLAKRWGRDVLHCGFCHGYEVEVVKSAV
jgi:thioredoxin reductase